MPEVFEATESRDNDKGDNGIEWPVEKELSVGVKVIAAEDPLLL